MSHVEEVENKTKTGCDVWTCKPVCTCTCVIVCACVFVCDRVRRDVWGWGYAVGELRRMHVSKKSFKLQDRTSMV